MTRGAAHTQARTTWGRVYDDRRADGRLVDVHDLRCEGVLSANGYGEVDDHGGAVHAEDADGVPAGVVGADDRRLQEGRSALASSR